MRIFSTVVAVIALIAGFISVSIVSKFRAMYEELDATLPNLTVTFLNTSGWIPGGIFLLAAILLFVLVAAKKTKVAGGIAIFTLIFLIGTAAVLPFVLMAPLSKAIHELEATQNIQEAEQANAGNPSTRPVDERRVAINHNQMWRGAPGSGLQGLDVRLENNAGHAAHNPATAC